LAWLFSRDYNRATAAVAKEWSADRMVLGNQDCCTSVVLMGDKPMRLAMPLLLSTLLLTVAAAPLSGPNNCGTPDEPKACPGGKHVSSGHVVSHKSTTSSHHQTPKS
jgi:hypothetical protein